MAPGWLQRGKPDSAVVNVLLDSSSAYAVSVFNDQVESFATVSGSSAADALTSVLSSFRGTDPVDVYVSSPALTFAEVETLPSKVPQAAGQVAAPGAHFAYLVSQADADALSVGVSSSVSEDLLASLKLSVPSRQVRFFPAPLLAGSLGRVVLYVGASCVWLAAFSDRVPLRVHTLDVPGVDALMESLASSGARRQVSAVLAGTGSDPLASGEVSRWATALAVQVSHWVGQWRSDGVVVPATLTVTGPGAASSYVTDALARTGLSAHLPDVGGVSVVPRGQRHLFDLPASLGASVSSDSVQFHTLTSTSTARRSWVRMSALLAAAVVVPSLLWAAPVVASSWWSERSLQDAISSAASSQSSTAALVTALGSQVSLSFPAASSLALSELTDYVAGFSSSGPAAAVSSVRVSSGVMRATVTVAGSDSVQFLRRVPSSWVPERVSQGSGVDGESPVDGESFTVTLVSRGFANVEDDPWLG